MTKTSRNDFAHDVVQGLRSRPRKINSKYFYDEQGSHLFDEICHLDEYYLTRCELEIMQEYAAEMGAQIGAGVRLVEYGSGSSTKTRTLLSALPDPVAYVPVDISREHLMRSAEEIADDYPELEVLPVCADFTQPFVPTVPVRAATHTAVYFPGSTIGNFSEKQALQLLRRIESLSGDGGGLLIGFDLQKDRETMEAAYNDSRGVTAQFNLNLLNRINRELDANLVPENFEHLAFYSDTSEAIETYIVSCVEQDIEIDGEEFSLGEGERISTEFSHKYTIEGFTEMAKLAGLRFRRHWTDSKGYFAVAHLVVE